MNYPFNTALHKSLFYEIKILKQQVIPIWSIKITIVRSCDVIQSSLQCLWTMNNATQQVNPSLSDISFLRYCHQGAEMHQCRSSDWFEWRSHSPAGLGSNTFLYILVFSVVEHYIWEYHVPFSWPEPFAEIQLVHSGSQMFCLRSWKPYSTRFMIAWITLFASVVSCLHDSKTHDKWETINYTILHAALTDLQ